MKDIINDDHQHGETFVILFDVDAWIRQGLGVTQLAKDTIQVLIKQPWTLTETIDSLDAFKALRGLDVHSIRVKQIYSLIVREPSIQERSFNIVLSKEITARGGQREGSTNRYS